jgi:hypothetical protein
MLRNIIKNASYLPGYHTKRKIIVFLIDDWGSIRTINKNTRDKLIKSGIKLDNDRFNYFDTLANAEDFSSLFDILRQYKDKNNNNPILNLVSVVANPDFDKIRINNFAKYYYQPFTETLNNYYGSDTFSYWKEGIIEKLIIPEFHGREHLNPHLWLKSLRTNDNLIRTSFDNHCIGIHSNQLSKYRGNYLFAFDFENEIDLFAHEQIISSGIKLFKNLFNQAPNHFTSSGLIHNKKHEDFTNSNRIKLIDVGKITVETLGNGKYKKKLKTLGQMNKNSQVYITRNVRFEPNADPNYDCVGSCLKDISMAFRWRQPAIISSHRVNFVGGIEEKNRKDGLIKLNCLLNQITKNWKDVEFMTVHALGNLLNKTNGNFD